MAKSKNPLSPRLPYRAPGASPHLALPTAQEILPPAPLGRAFHVPSNAGLLTRAKVYESELPAVVQAKIREVREHFLLDVLPHVLAVQNGIADGVDVVKHALKETPDAGAYSALLTELVKSALAAKAVTFASKITELDPLSMQLYLQAYLAKLEGHHGNSTEKIMSEVQRILDMQRSKETDGSESLLRPFPTESGNSRRYRDRVRGDATGQGKDVGRNGTRRRRGEP